MAKAAYGKVNETREGSNVASKIENRPAKVTAAFHAELLRPDDLLHLQVDGSNLHLTSDEYGAPVLTVVDRQQSAFLRFTFAPQTIAESAFFEAAPVPGTNTPIQPEGDPRRPDPDSDPKSPKGDDPLAAPGTTSDTPHVKHRLPTVAQIGHPSRLVFVVPAGAAIPFTFEGLLEWSKLDLSVNGIAAIGDNPTADQIAKAPAIHEPGPNETAIELPY